MNDLPASFVREPEQAIKTDLSMPDGLYVHSMLIPIAGTYAPQHVHKYDHSSVIAYGSASVWTDGVFQGTFEAPAAITIKAGHLHVFRSEVDATVILCIHRVGPDGEPEVLQEHQLVPSEEAA